MKIRHFGPASFHQHAEFFFSKNILQKKAGQNNKYYSDARFASPVAFSKHYKYQLWPEINTQ